MRDFLVILGFFIFISGITACATDASNISAAQAASYEAAGSSVIGHQSTSDMPDVDANPY